MPESFNPYHMWLGIPPEEQPANHYRLLGITPFETNADVISNAADQRMAHLRTFQAGKNGALSQTVLNEVSAAVACLLVPEKKQAYDQALRQKLAAAKPAATSTPATTPAKRAVPQATPMAKPIAPITQPAPQATPLAQAAPKPLATAAPIVNSSAPAVPIVNTSPAKNAQATPKQKGLSTSAIVMASIAGVALVAGLVIVVITMSQSPQQIAKETGPKKTASANKSVPTKEPIQPEPAPAIPSNPPEPTKSPTVPTPTPAEESVPSTPEIPPKVEATTPTPMPVEPANVPMPAVPAPVVPMPAPAEQPTVPTPPATTPPPATVAEPETPTSKMPGEAQLAAARKLLVDAFGAEAQKATDADAKRALAIKLIKLAEETTDDLAARYVLTDTSRKLFIGAGDVSAALLATGKLVAWFELEGAAATSLRQSTFTGLSDASLLSASAREELADRVKDEVETAIEEQRLADAEEYAQLGLKVTRGLKEPERKRVANQQRTLVTKLKSDFSKYEQARETLKGDATNPAANLLAGKYLCTVLHDWEQGLTHLAAGGDAALSEVIESDRRAQGEAENQAELQFAAADAWYGWQERPKTADRELVGLAKSRAHHWYEAAAPKLAGLNKIKADKRVAELAPAEGTTPKPSPRAVASAGSKTPADSAADKKAKSNAKSRVPVPFEMATASVCEVLQGKRGPVGRAEQAEEFKAPVGDGRSGANGLVMMAGDAWKKQGSTWKFKYVFNGSANGMKVAHPFQNGHVLVSMNHEKLGFGLNAGGNWSDVGWRMAGQRKLPFEITPEGQALFPLATDTEYDIISQLTADGRYGLFINKQLVIFSVVPNGIALPLDLQMPDGGKPNALFSGGSMPRALKPGEGLILIGPLDNGINKLSGVEFGPKVVE